MDRLPQPKPVKRQFRIRERLVQISEELSGKKSQNYFENLLSYAYGLFTHNEPYRQHVF